VLQDVGPQGGVLQGEVLHGVELQGEVLQGEVQSVEPQGGVLQGEVLMWQKSPTWRAARRDRPGLVSAG
jgi:hypothetical protein